MSGDEFFGYMTQISDFIFDLISRAWAVIQSNWLLILSFAITIVSLFVYIFKRIRNIKSAG